MVLGIFYRQKTKDESALREAIRKKDLTEVQDLVERKGVNVEAVDMYGRTALLVACYDGAGLAIVQYLVESAKANVDAENMFGNNVVHGASCHNDLAVLQYLVETCGVGAHATSKVGETALHLAASEGHLAVVQYLVETCRLDVTKRTGGFYAPAMTALMEGKVGVALVFAFIGLMCKESTAFDEAVLYAKIEVIRYFVESGSPCATADEIQKAISGPILDSADKDVVTAYLQEQLRVTSAATVASGSCEADEFQNPPV